MKRCKVKKTAYCLIGGPFNGEVMYWSVGGSLPINYNGWQGYYNVKGVWTPT